MKLYYQQIIEPISRYERKATTFDLFVAENHEKVTKEFASQGIMME